MALIKLFAGTDIGLRDNNEDNFVVCPDLTKDEWRVPAEQQESILLGQWGCLVVVADGMGGMNAGEVASDIAVKTVQQMFTPSALSEIMLEKPEAVKAYLKKVIIQADLNIKKKCKETPATEGMGSTIVIAWLLENNVYIGWLGDSRAYLYSDVKGIKRLSKDHSYVQQLVDAKILTEQEAMNHPDSNVIVRSLGDTSQKAKPDIIVYPVNEGDVILLCSDGLCGVCTDEEIADIIKQSHGDLQSCKEILTEIALEAGGSDNITVALLQMVSAEVNKKNSIGHKKNNINIGMLLTIVVICLGAFVFMLMRKLKEHPKEIGVEKIELTLSSKIITFQDTITYKVKISPDSANQSYHLEYDNKHIAVDTAHQKITMKDNFQGEVWIKAVAEGDNSKRDSIQLNLKKGSEESKNLNKLLQRVKVSTGSTLNVKKSEEVIKDDKRKYELKKKGEDSLNITHSPGTDPDALNIIP